MTPLTFSIPQNGFNNEETHHRRPYCDRTAGIWSYAVLRPITEAQTVGGFEPVEIGRA